MDRKIEFLDPTRKLVDEVVGWLCARVKTEEGARTLAHLMVVVPTAQSGRNLRLALAREAARRGWGGVLPPRVVQPMSLVRPAKRTFRDATPVECAVAFQQYVKTHREDVLKLDRLVRPESFDDLTARFALFDQLEDIWRALAGRGLLMRDVRVAGREALAADIGDETTRWEQLAALEEAYFGFLHAHGVAYPTESVCAAKTDAQIVGDEIEEIVLPALVDPIRVLGDVLGQQLAAGRCVTVLLHADPAEAGRFDTWGWPRREAWTGSARPVLDRFSDADVVCAPNASALARIAAADFPEATADRALPSLALCDEDLHQAVSAAFLNRGYVVHNPERHPLVQSSLGRLLRNLIALYGEGDMPWRECMGVLRSADVQAALDLSGTRRESVLRGADAAQNAFIPNAVPKGFAFPGENGLQDRQKEDFAAFCAAGRALEALLAKSRAGASLAVFLRRVLKAVFAAHAVGGRAGEREFLAAAEGVRDFLAALEGDLVSSLALTDAEFESLARRALDGVVYSLEPDSADALKTEGWLELPWTLGEQIALVGLHEGSVPDSIVGHPFLPDALRRELGLVTNEDRLARDTWIFSELLAAHAPHAVRSYVARTNDDGDIRRPSRLLYLCSDADLSARVRTLFGDLPAERTDRKHLVEWPLALPDDVPAPDHLSASALDTYVKCPFTYLLKYGLRMNPFREKRELEANDFGTFIHDVLERYARTQIERGDDQLTDAAEIRRLILEEIVPVFRARYVKPTLNVELQLRAAEGRLALFAEKQAEWARRGWRIREAEYKLDDVIPELGARIRGSIDRIDENIGDSAERHWCLVDYKTWDRKDLARHVVTTAAKTEKNLAHLALARALGYPCLRNRAGEERQRVLSVQLPVYGKGYAAKNPKAPFRDMAFTYFILGRSADETGVGDDRTRLADAVVQAAVDTAKRAVALIGKGVFWPPGPTDEWKWDYPGLFVADPAHDIGGTEWARRQTERLEANRV